MSRSERERLAGYMRNVMTASMAGQGEVAGKTPDPRTDVSTRSGGLDREPLQPHKPVIRMDIDTAEIHWSYCLACGVMAHRVCGSERHRAYWRHHWSKRHA